MLEQSSTRDNPENQEPGGRRATLADGPVRRRAHSRDVEQRERGRADLEVTRRSGGAGSIPARRIRLTKAAGPARAGRPAGTLTEDRSVTPVPPTDDRPKVVPNLVTTPPPKDDVRKVGPSPVSTPPPKDDGRKAALNPLVPLHEAILAAGPSEVWKKVAESLNPLLQDWQSDANKQRWRRLAANLAAATAIAAGMAILWDRGEKFNESDAEPDAR
jgi:hypothetical protein